MGQTPHRKPGAIKPKKINGMPCYTLGQFSKLVSISRMTAYRWAKGGKASLNLGIELKVITDNVTGHIFVEAASTEAMLKALEAKGRFTTEVVSI